jgi:methylmalonyl-CoA mutase
MTTSDRLLAAELPPVSLGQWRRRVEDELGAGASFEQELGKPLYTAEDGGGGDEAGFPGLPPYTRGAAAIRRGWKVAQEIRREDEAGVFAEDTGVEAAWVDPQAPSLEGILAHLDLTRLAVVLGSGTGTAAPLLVAEAARQDVPEDRLRGGLGCDPLGVLASRGDLPGGLDRAFEAAAGLAAWCAEKAPGLSALLVDTAPYREAGASAVEEIAFLAASGVEVFRRLTGDGKLDVETIARQLLFAVSVGSPFFLEIAKLRAARLVWAKVARACGASAEGQAMRLHARTSAAGRTALDPWANQLRETTECFAAAIGGAEAIVTAPFDEPLGRPSPAARRLAVDTQHVLREEAGLDRVLDPAGGSYYVEKSTDDLARAAWTLFQDVERRGGMARCLTEGWIRERIAATAEKTRQDLAAAAEAFEHGSDP